MSEITETLKGVLADGLRIVNRAASSVASATTYKLTELDSRSRRREAIVELGEKVYAMFQAGVEMPEEALPLLTELRALDEGLESMRVEHQEKKTAEKLRNAEEDAVRREQRATEKAARMAARQAEKEARAAAAAQAAAEEAAAAARAAIEEQEDVTEAQEAPVVEAEAEAPVQEPPVAENAAEATAEDDDLMLM
ncbi:MAG: hypothetical protein IJE07_06210 [Clostridia bacterium]|nr:hypothetical protein [Clostridia bacterium]